MMMRRLALLGRNRSPVVNKRRVKETKIPCSLLKGERYNAQEYSRV